MTGKLMDIDDWRKARFAGKPPSMTTVRRWCREGVIPAKKIGGTWFVELDAERRQTGNPLVDSILEAII